MPLPEFRTRIIRTVASGYIDEFIPDAVQFGPYETTRRHTSEDSIPHSHHRDKLNVRLLHRLAMERNLSCWSLQILVDHEI